MPISLLLAIAVAAGVAVGVFADPSVADLSPWLIAASSLMAITFHSRSQASSLKTQAPAFAGALAMAGAACLIGAAANSRAIHAPLRTLLDEQLGGFAIDSIETIRNETPTVIEGVLMEDAQPSESGAVVRVQVERALFNPVEGEGFSPRPDRRLGGVSLTVVGDIALEKLSEWRAGRRVRAPTVLRRPARYLDEGVPDLERQLARRGTTLVGTVKSGALVEVLGRGRRIDEWAAAARAFIRRSMARWVASHDPQSGAIATAILIGDRNALDRDVERKLQEAGTYHVIAISGGNIAILAGLVLGALWLVGLRGRSGAVLAIAVLIAYAFLTGGGSSVLRATVMAGIYLGLRLLDQRTAPLHAMALTAASLLLVSPLSIGDVGFWLTFGATAAIVAGANRITLPKQKWIRPAVALIAASACAEIVLMPVGALIFQRVTLAGLAANLAAVPCMAIVQIGAMITAAADAAGIDRIAGLAGWITHVSAWALVRSAAIVDIAPWLLWRIPPPSMWLVVSYYACLLLWWWTRRRSVGIACAAVFLWIATAPPTLARIHGDGQLHLAMMDVGQGDAMLVTLPNGRTLMVDTGGVSARGDFDIGDRVLGPALRARGVRRLDYLAFTHGDPDHIGGAIALTRDFSPLEVWQGVPVPAHEPTNALHAAATRARAAWRTLQRGDRLELGGVELRVHHPPSPDWERQKVRNNDSLVFELRYGQVSLLLTGDIEREGEDAVAPLLDLNPIVVLKAPHHGSGTSSSEAFLRAVKPSVVLISCGRGNPYGHPVPYVLDRYRAAGADVFRTDRDGQIDLSTDGRSLRISTFQMQHEGHEESFVGDANAKHAQGR